MSHVLIVDADARLLAKLELAFQAHGHSCVTATTAALACAAAAHGDFDLAVLDLYLGGTSGLALLRQLHQFDPGLPIVIMTQFPTVQTAVQAMRRGAVHYIRKPFAVPDLFAALRKPGTAIPAKPSTEPKPMHEVEWDAIREAIAYYNGNLSQAARALRIGRATLWRRIRERQPAEVRRRHRDE